MRELEDGNFRCTCSSSVRFRQNWIIFFKLVNLFSSTVCLLLKDYIPFLFFFIGKEFTERKGIANRVDCLGLEIGLFLFLCNPIERQTHSLVPCCNFYTVAILIFFLPCLSLSVCLPVVSLSPSLPPAHVSFKKHVPGSLKQE